MQKSEVIISSGAGQGTIYSEINHNIISLNYEQEFIHQLLFPHP